MDWIDEALLEDEQNENTVYPDDLSSVWNSQGLIIPNEVDDVVIDRLRELRATFENFAKLLGRDDINFRFSTDKDLGTACAYFANITKNEFRDPVVVIDTGLLKLCKTSLDPIIGTVLHEIGHILFTRKFFTLSRRNHLARHLGRSFFNMLEDHRIERRLVEIAPGYSRYLQAARQLILLDRWHATEVREWANRDELSRMTTMVAAFIRFPRMFRVMPELKTWKTRTGVVFFEKLRKILKHSPKSEDHAMSMARKLLTLYPKMSNGHRWGGSNTITLEDVLERSSAASEGTPKWLVDRLENGDSTKHEAGFVRLELPKRFFDECDDLAIALERAPKQALESPKWTRERTALRDQIAVLRQQSFIPNLPRRVMVGGRIRGLIDSRSLWKAPFDQKIFGQREARPSQRLANCTVAVLLDSSSSMWGNYRFRQAFRMAVLLYEGFHEAIDVRIYSHFQEMKITVLEHASPRVSMESYFPRGKNIDSQAILLVGSILKELPGHKILACISDGLPHGYAGDGVTETRDAVATVRKSGVRVIGVNIGNDYDGTIYAPFQIHIGDAQCLPSETAKLVLREIRKVIG